MKVTLEELQATVPENILKSRNDVAIAKALPHRVSLVPTEIGNWLILDTVGLAVGNALLDMLNTSPDFRYIKPLLEQGRLDISGALSRAALDSLVGVVDCFTQAHADTLKALAERITPVSFLEVAEVLNAAGY